MKYRTPSNPDVMPCCVVGCDEQAMWQITTGPSYEDMTDSCPKHVAQLIGDAPLENIGYLGPISFDTIDVVITDRAESPRVVLEGYYGREPKRPQPITEGPEWVASDRLRIHVPAGWLVG